MEEFFIFPYEKIDKGSNVIIWGTGNVGRDYLAQIEKNSYCNLLFFIDSKKYGKELKEYNVYPPSYLNNSSISYDYILIATKIDINQIEIEKELEELNIPKEKVIKKISYVYPRMQVHYQDSYSQHGEDRIIYNAFCHMGYFRDGNKLTYIDVGAHDPYIISNTALFYKLGCRGINIEANPDLIEAFYSERHEDTNICCGVGAKEGVLPFYICENQGLNTFNKENIEYNEKLVERDTGKKIHYSIEKTIDVPVKTLPHIINEFCKGVWPDFMSIDVEGMEYSILEICDLTKGPKLIAVEVNLDGSRFVELFRNKGYFPYLWYRENILFVRNDMEKYVH